jgi:hypothetical protein
LNQLLTLTMTEVIPPESVNQLILFE